MRHFVEQLVGTKEVFASGWMSKVRELRTRKNEDLQEIRMEVMVEL